MKGWKLTKPLKLKLTDIDGGACEQSNLSKVKITKALLTFSDLLRYTGEISTDNVVLGSYGIGIVSQIDTNLFGLEKGLHVYVEPYRPCLECFNCKNDEEDKCSDIYTAGEDYDGFLSDFVEVDSSKLFILPDSVSDTEALFINHISLAIAIIEKLDIQKGEYVAVVGGNNFGNILSQLLIYHQAVPILVDNDPENIRIAQDSGIYYTLGPDEVWNKEVSNITGGRMAKHVVYISDSDIPVSKAFALASFNAGVVFTGTVTNTSAISFTQAVKKQLCIHCVNGAFGNTAASINLIANKAIDVSKLKINTASYQDVPDVLKNMKDEYDSNEKFYETIIDQI
ncbi:MAG: hypothetical protein E7369_03700 [Clostridiales bacterium]|nr:hypothetical protein [Clostridiales bacterium]